MPFAPVIPGAIRCGCGLRRFLTLLAFAGTAGLALANKAATPVPRPDPWPKRHAECVARAAQGQIDVLFLGDSITDRWREEADGLPVWQREFAPLRAANFGIRGDQTQHVLWRLQNGAAGGVQPKVVVLLIGTNNTRPKKDGVTPVFAADEIAAGVAAIVKELRKRFPAAKVLLQAIFPRGAPSDPRRTQIKEVNERIARLADHQIVFFVSFGDRFLAPDATIPPELMPDGVHLSTRGYEIWAEAIREPLRALLEPPPSPRPG
jgi:lysophospholipase L1-like esterase